MLTPVLPPVRACILGILTLATLSLGSYSSFAASDEASLPRLGDRPDFNGIWQAMNTANWNLEAHSATQLEDFWELGAIGAIPAGTSVVREGTIPYLPEALEQREENQANWPQADPEASCYMLGVPRVTYHDLPFQVVQSPGDDMLMVYPFAATNRVILMDEEVEPLPVDSWMGRSYGRWEGDTLVVTTINQNGESWLDRAGNHASNQLVVTERFSMTGPNHIWYEATLEDPQTYSEPWTIEMPLYRRMEENAQLLEHKCVPFAEEMLYQDLLDLD